MQLVAQHSGKCAEGRNNGSPSVRNQIRQWTCSGGSNQHWSREDMVGGYFRLRNVDSNLCMDVVGASTNDGADIQQVACNNTFSQQFCEN